MIVAGIGCRRGASAEAIVALVHETLAARGLAPRALDAMASLAVKAGEAGLAAAAQRLSVPLVLCQPGEIARVADRILTPSVRAAVTVGVEAVAEGAALAAAGRNARLLGPRAASASVTCAIAEGDGP